SFYSTPHITNTGAGSLTVDKAYGFFGTVSDVGAGTTVNNLYAGGDVQVDSQPGTIQNLWGWHVNGLQGTNRFPFGSVSIGSPVTNSGTVPLGEGAFGVIDNSPTKFFFRDDAQHTWVMGYTTMTGTGRGLDAGPSTLYFAPSGIMTVSAAESDAA